jgi:outer membrane biosynthesis protein TonB
MPNSLRLSFGALLLAVAAACSRSSEQPAVSSDLEQDLAKAGGANVQLAGTSTNRVDVVSASERVQSPVPTPKAKSVSRAPSANRGVRAPVKRARKETPVAAAPAPQAPEPAPAEQPRVEREPDPTPAPQTRPQAPVPSRQPEPRGGWKTPGEVIRNAPFPLNP